MVKVTIQCHVIYPSICAHSISPKPFEQVSLYFIQMFPIVRQCAEPMAQLQRLKVKVTGFTLEFFVPSISPEPFERFYKVLVKCLSHFRQCAEPLTQLHRLWVKVHLEFLVCSRSQEPLKKFHYTLIKCLSGCDGMLNQALSCHSFATRCYT